MLNPYAIAACAAKSLSQLRVLLTALSALCAVHGASLALAVVHALNSVLFFMPLMFTPALVLWGADAHATFGRWRSRFGLRRSDAWSAFCWCTVQRMALGIVLLLLFSLALARSLSFVRSVYGSRIFADDLAPTAGLVWYFFVEMFEHFRGFFVMVVNLHMWAYMVPIVLKYRADPLFALTTLVGIQCLFQNYASMGETALYLALWSLSYRRLSDYMRFPMVTTLLFAYSTLLLPAFHYLWLYAGSANANFYYAVNLVHAIGIGSLLLDSTWAWGRERWELERGNPLVPTGTHPEAKRVVVQM